MPLIKCWPIRRRIVSDVDLIRTQGDDDMDSETAENGYCRATQTNVDQVSRTGMQFSSLIHTTILHQLHFNKRGSHKCLPDENESVYSMGTKSK